MKKIYKAPKWFVKLFDEGIMESKKLEDHITGIVGYGRHWCDQNQAKVDEILTDKQKDKANEIMDRIEAIKKYAWSRYFYENWSSIKSLVTSPLSNANYDEKNQNIIISDPNIFKKVISKISEKISESLIKRKIKKLKNKSK